MMFRLTGMAMAALLMSACSQPAVSSQAESQQLPATADNAGALNNSARAPVPDSITGSATCDADTAYCPSAVQLRVDRSFSAFAIDSTLAAAGSRLVRTDTSESCAAGGGCEWRDANGVLHFISGDSEDDNRILIKIVNADQFIGRPISALGIGTARRQAEVLANIRRFLPGVEIDCNPDHVSGNVGPVECGATLNPGWIQIGFDREGNLLRVRFDGYQFT